MSNSFFHFKVHEGPKRPYVAPCWLHVTWNTTTLKLICPCGPQQPCLGSTGQGGGHNHPGKHTQGTKCYRGLGGRENGVGWVWAGGLLSIMGWSHGWFGWAVDSSTMDIDEVEEGGEGGSLGSIVGTACGEEAGEGWASLEEALWACLKFLKSVHSASIWDSRSAIVSSVDNHGGWVGLVRASWSGRELVWIWPWAEPAVSGCAPACCSDTTWCSQVGPNLSPDQGPEAPVGPWRHGRWRQSIGSPLGCPYCRQ